MNSSFHEPCDTQKSESTFWLNMAKEKGFRVLIEKTTSKLILSMYQISMSSVLNFVHLWSYNYVTKND